MLVRGKKQVLVSVFRKKSLWTHQEVFSLKAAVDKTLPKSLNLNTTWWFKDDIIHYVSNACLTDGLELVSWSPQQHFRLNSPHFQWVRCCSTTFFLIMLTAVLFLATWWHMSGEHWATNFTAAWQYITRLVFQPWAISFSTLNMTRKRCRTTQMLAAQHQRHC